ncbi:MAG: dockerin type I repeat-containing protein [Clostridia bacterium]|nr:dockerin type I repeat-containing protein [Clostridia bacterium]
MKKFISILTVITLLLSMGALSLTASALIDADIVYGDLNGDGKVDLNDAIGVLEAAAGLNSISDPAVVMRADINSDGAITIYDARQILRGSAGLTNLQPSGAFSGFEGDETFQTPDQAIAVFNTLLNSVKTDKPGFIRSEDVDVINFGIKELNFVGINFGSSTESVSNMIRDMIVTESEPEMAQTVIKGQNCDNAMSAETETYVSRLKESDVYGVKADFNQETGIITIQIALADCEIANVSQTAYADVFSPVILQENSESIVENIFGANTFEDARRKELKNAVLTVVIDSATTQVMSYSTTYETHIYLENSTFGINSTLSAKLRGVEYATRITVTYDDFQW